MVERNEWFGKRTMEETEARKDETSEKGPKGDRGAKKEDLLSGLVLLATFAIPATMEKQFHLAGELYASGNENLEVMGFLIFVPAFFLALIVAGCLFAHAYKGKVNGAGLAAFVIICAVVLGAYGDVLRGYMDERAKHHSPPPAPTAPVVEQHPMAGPRYSGPLVTITVTTSPQTTNVFQAAAIAPVSKKKAVKVVTSSPARSCDCRCAPSPPPTQKQCVDTVM